jgi:hypothetical protein
MFSIIGGGMGRFFNAAKSVHDVPAVPHPPMLTIFSEPCLMSSPFGISFSLEMVNNRSFFMGTWNYRL